MLSYRVDILFINNLQNIIMSDSGCILMNVYYFVLGI